MLAWALLLKCSIVSYVDRPLVISSLSSRSSLYWKEKSYSCRGEPSGVWVWQLFALRAKAEKDFFLNFFLCSSFLWHIVEVGRMLKIFLLCCELEPVWEPCERKLWPKVGGLGWRHSTWPGKQARKSERCDFPKLSTTTDSLTSALCTFCHL